MRIFIHIMFIILSFLYILSINAQVEGVIFDQKSNEPIEFATISIEGTSIGVMSNENGQFKIFMPEAYQDKNLIISCLGYKNDTLVMPYKHNKVYNIYLSEEQILLPEIVIKTISPVKILEKAISKINENYATKPVYLNAYYREMVETNGTFVKYVDSAVKIYYSAYNTLYDIGDFYYIDFEKHNINIHGFPQGANKAPSKYDAVQIIEVRRSDDLEHFTNRWDFEEGLKKFEISGGALQITSADIVKHKKDIINPATWKYYQFTYEGTVTKNNKEVYKISFKPKKKNKIAIWKGTTYIDKGSYAFIAFEYSIDEKCQNHLRKSNTEIVIELDKKQRKETKKSVVKRIIENTNQAVRISYNEYQGKWYLSHIRIRNKIENTGNVFEKIEYSTYLDLYVNNIQLQNVLPLEEKKVFLTSNYSYLFLYPSKYNPTFWKNYNFPVPAKMFKKALLDLEKDKSLQQQFQKN